MRVTLANLIIVLMLIIGIFLIGFFGYGFFTHYNLFSLEKADAVVVHKKSEINIGFFPKYYITVKDKADHHLKQQRVSRKTLLSTHVGDDVQGYKSNTHFFTIKQLMIDVTYGIIFSLIGVIFVLFSILFFMRNTLFFNKVKGLLKSVRMPPFLVKYSKEIFIIIAILFLFGGKILHLTQIYFKKNEETSAKIIEMEKQSGYGRYAVNKYYATIVFDVGQYKSIKTKIKIPKETFELYEEGYSIDICYQTSNPYYVFLPSEKY